MALAADQIKRTTFYLLIILTAVNPRLAMGGSKSLSDCELALTRAKTFAKLPKSTLFPLPKPFLDRLHAHKLMELSPRLNEGQNVSFSISNYYGPGHVTLTMGESIQSQFVAKTLKEVFPRAEIVNETCSASRKCIRLEIHDSGEVRDAVQDEYLNMPMLKLANPGAGAVPHGSLRKQFGIPPQFFVASLYLRWPGEAQNLLEVLSHVKPPDVLFLTGGGHELSSEEMRSSLKTAIEKGYQVINLSQFNQTTLVDGKRYIFINDQRGMMPWIYNLADIAIVQGPINFLEPLTAGAKTIYFDSPQFLGQYGNDEFTMMSSIANQTGGAFPVASLGQLQAVLPGAIAADPKIIPPYLVENQGASPEDAFLNQLQQQIIRQLGG